MSDRDKVFIAIMFAIVIVTVSAVVISVGNNLRNCIEAKP